MNCKIILLTSILLYSVNLLGQTVLDCDLIELSKLTLSQSPIVQQNKLRIQNAEGNLLIQRSTFDHRLIADFSLRRDKSHLFDVDPRNSAINNNILETNNTDFSLGLQRRFRVGLLATVSLDYNQNSNNYPFDRFNQEVIPFFSNHMVSSNISLTQPLLRGRGYKVTTALEKAAELNLERNEYNFEFTTSLELLYVATAYWQYLAAYKNLSIFKENEERVSNVLDIATELVKADKKPAGDLVQVKADLVNQQRQTTIAEQNLYNARLKLGRVIGLNDYESNLLGIPKNEFPIIKEFEFQENLLLKEMIKIASENRKDLKGLENSKESLQLELDFMTNHQKPQLDLTGFATYGGMNMGNGLDQALNTFSNRQGRNYGIGVRLDFSFPLNNNLAKGNYTIAKTALQNQLIGYENLQRNININVNIAVNNFKNNFITLKKAEETLKYSKEAYKNEQLKFQNGLTTLLNLILFQERLTLAQRDYVLAEQRFAISIITLRHETGTLLTRADNTIPFTINKSIFYSVPKSTN